MKKRVLTVFVAIALLLALPMGISCQSEAPVSNGEETVTFTDALGREVRVSRAPVRVAALIGSFADVWQLAGGTLCASAEDAWEDFELDMGDAVNIGGAHSPSLELLIASDPQFVIASASTASNVNMMGALEAMGIPVAYFDVDCFTDYLNMLRICTDITGRKDLYEQNGLAIAREIERIKQDFADADIPAEKRTVLLLRVSSSSIKAKGGEGTILGEMLADIGCINIADRDSSLLDRLSVESVMREQPYRIFAVAMGSNTEAAAAALNSMIKENAAWSTLEAVEAGRVHMMDRRLFNLKPNARWAQAYEELYEILVAN